MSEEGSDKKTLQGLLRVICRRWRLFLLSSSLVAMATLLASHRLTPVYTGTASVEHRADVAAPAVLQGGSESFEATSKRLWSELAGYQAMVQVAEDVGLLARLPRDANQRLTDAGLSRRDEIVRGLMRNTKLGRGVTHGRVEEVSVSVTHSDRKLAPKIANRLVGYYIEATSREIVDRLTTSRDGFLKGEVERSRKRLFELKKQRLDLDVKHAGMNPENPGALKAGIDQITGRIDALRLQQKTDRDALARLTSLERGLIPTSAPASQPTEPVQVVRGPNPELRRLEDQLRNYNDRLDMALFISHMTESHPTVKTLRTKIAALEKKIKDTDPETVLHRVYGSAGGANGPAAQRAAARAIALAASRAGVQSRLDADAQEIKRLEGQLAQKQKFMTGFAAAREKYLDITDEIAKETAERERWQQQLDDVEVALAAEAANRRTRLKPKRRAQKQTRPSSPKLFMVLVGSTAFGLAVGAALVLLLQFLDSSIATTDDARDHFDLPVHGAINEIVTPQQRAMKRLRQWPLTVVVAVVLLTGLAMSGWSVVLWLRPEQYEKYKDSPPVRVYRRVSEAVWRAL